MARVRFAGIVTAAALAGSLAACGSSSPTASSLGSASSPSPVQSESAASAAATTASDAPSATSAPSTAAATTSGAAKAPDAAKVVAAAWLPASQFPLVGTKPWQLDPYHAATSGVAVNAEMDEQAAYFVCQPTQLARAGVRGIQSRDYHLDPEPNPDDVGVQQLQLFFADPAAAKAGLTAIEGWHTDCAAGPSQNTASAADAVAYLVVNRGGGDTSHEYFVQRGSVVDAVVITGRDMAAASVKGTSQDKATLAAMAARLCAYAGAC